MTVHLEETLYIFPMQGFCNNIYDNVYETIGWYCNDGKKNVERGILVMVDASDVGTGVESMSKGGVKMVQVTYSPMSIRL